MDRTPSVKSLTDLPRSSDSTSSSPVASDGRTCSSRSMERQALLVKDKMMTAGVPQHGKEHGKGFVCPSEAVESLEQHYTSAVQQLETLQQMYTRLNEHNDDLEDAFMLLRARLDALRAALVNRISRTAKELRVEVHLLRETVCFLLQDFSSDLLWHRQQILSRLQEAHGEKKSLLLLPFASVHSAHTPTVSPTVTPLNREDISTSWESQAHVYNSPLQKPATDTVRGGVHQAATGELPKALEWSTQQSTELEEKLRQQRENYEEHMRCMKALYKQKESTLQHRVKLLEHFLKRDGNNTHLLLLDDGRRTEPQPSSTQHKYRESSSSGSSHSSSIRRKREKRKGAVNVWPSTDDALKRSTCQTRTFDRTARHPKNGRNEVKEREMEIMRHAGINRSFSHSVESDHERTSGTAIHEGPHRHARIQHRHHSQEEGFSPSVMWSDDPLKYKSRFCDDLERRVQAQTARGHQRGGTGSHYTEYCLRPDLRTRREEKELEMAASRLLSAVSKAHGTPSRWQQDQRPQQQCGRSHAVDDDVLNRLYYVPRSPPRRPVTNTYLAAVPKSGVVPRPDALSDVATVARGLWAEKLLLQRSGRRQRHGTN